MKNQNKRNRNTTKPNASLPDFFEVILFAEIVCTRGLPPIEPSRVSIGTPIGAATAYIRGSATFAELLQVAAWAADNYCDVTVDSPVFLRELVEFLHKEELAAEAQAQKFSLTV